MSPLAKRLRRIVTSRSDNLRGRALCLACSRQSWEYLLEGPWLEQEAVGHARTCPAIQLERLMQACWRLRKVPAAVADIPEVQGVLTEMGDIRQLRADSGGKFSAWR